MPPRRKAERDVSETDGTDGRHRRMSLRRKARKKYVVRKTNGKYASSGKIDNRKMPRK